MVWHLRVKHLGTFSKEQYCVWNNCLSFSKYDLCDLLFPHNMVDNLVCCTGGLYWSSTWVAAQFGLYLLYAFNGMYVGVLNDSHLTIIFLLYNFSHNWAGDQKGGNEHVRENPRSPMLMSSKLLDQTNANCGCSMFMCDHWKCSVDVSRSNRVEKNVALCKWAVMQWENTNRSEDTGAHLISCEMVRY